MFFSSLDFFRIHVDEISILHSNVYLIFHERCIYICCRINGSRDMTIYMRKTALLPEKKKERNICLILNNRGKSRETFFVVLKWKHPLKFTSHLSPNTLYIYKLKISGKKEKSIQFSLISDKIITNFIKVRSMLVPFLDILLIN